MLLRDKFWLWGHPEGCYNASYGNTGVSRMTPMEACLYLGVKNTFMVPDGEHNGTTVNRRQYNKSFKTLNEVGWECFDAGNNPEKIEMYIEEAREFSNIGRVVFDDFQKQNKDADMPIENLLKVRKRLHENDVRPLDMWMVLYTHEFGLEDTDDDKLAKFIDTFDGIIMWTWWERDVPLIPEKYEIFKKLTANKRRMMGCYLYDFGDHKQATADAVKWQLDWYREKLLAGEIEGVVLHTNTMADLDYEAYDAACEWMDAHGDEVLPD